MVHVPEKWLKQVTVRGIGGIVYKGNNIVVSVSVSVEIRDGC